LKISALTSAKLTVAASTRQQGIIDKMFVVFDLDGTLACCAHRQHMIADWEPAPPIGAAGAAMANLTEPNWEAPYRACVDDKPMRATINTLIAFRAAGAAVEIWTGRSDLVRPETERWLMNNGIGNYHLKRMRPHGDHQPDVHLKRKWLYAPFGERPDLVFEDRARVVAMWREEGIPCFQVAPGEF
jgi:hypothetical protein